MINEKKTALMARLAIEEKHDKRQSFMLKSFWFNDFITTELWKAFLLISAAFALVVVLGLVAFSDTWTYTYHVADVIELGKWLVRSYGLVILFGLLLCLQCHIYRYIKAYRKRERIRKGLRQLDRLYKAQARMENNGYER